MEESNEIPVGTILEELTRTLEGYGHRYIDFKILDRKGDPGVKDIIITIRTNGEKLLACDGIAIENWRDVVDAIKKRIKIVAIDLIKKI